jgi:hypothetical protein
VLRIPAQGERRLALAMDAQIAHLASETLY